MKQKLELSIVCPACAEDCTSGACRPACAIHVIDQLLSTPGAVTGEEADLLLDFRHVLRVRSDAESALCLFCDVRRRLEQRHYLALFRLRRWLENHLVTQVRVCPAATPVRTRVKLDCYCIEAVRRSCLCEALRQGVPLLAPRLSFQFRPANAVSDHGCDRMSDPHAEIPA